MKVVVNRCYGGFGLSDLAYERMIEFGIPVRKYIEEKRDKNGLFKRVPENEGEVIFDRTLTKDSEQDIKFMGRYWETWLDENRTHPLLLKVVKELGSKSWGRHAKLVIIEIPDNIEWEIDEYDGIETVHEKHRSW